MADFLKVPPITFLHASDLHLGATLVAIEQNLQPLAARARYVALDRLVEVARQKQVKIILFAGDIFDSPNPPLSARVAFIEACEKFSAMNAKVFISPGNHDPWLENGIWPNFPDIKGVHIFSPTPSGIALEDLNLWIAGVAHNSSHVAEDLTEKLPSPPNGLKGIAVLHCDPNSNQAESKHLPYAPASLSTLREKNFTYWALGHWHKPQILNENPYVVMSGALQGAHVGEPNNHGAYLGELNNDYCQIKFLGLSPLVYHDLVLDDLAEIDDLTFLLLLIKKRLLESNPLYKSEYCLRLTLKGPLSIWPLFNVDKIDETKEEIKETLGLSGLILVNQLTPIADISELSQKDDILGRMLKMLGSLEDSPEYLETIASKLHPLNRQQDHKQRQEHLEKLLPKVKALALSSLWTKGKDS